MTPSSWHPHTGTLMLAPSHDTLMLAPSCWHPHIGTLTLAPSCWHPHVETALSNHNYLFFLLWQSSWRQSPSPDPSSEELEEELESEELLDGRPVSLVRSTSSAISASSGLCSCLGGGWSGVLCWRRCVHVEVT